MCSMSLRSAWGRWNVTAGLLFIAAVALTLNFMGRRPWCQCNSVIPWSWDIWSMHNSQHLLDPYTFTHVQHGVLLYALLWAVLGARWPAGRALLAVAVEAAWEIVENTNIVIESYRESTMALNYTGDSIANSIADIIAFGLGYSAAIWLPAWVAAVGFLGVEMSLLLTIRDGLLLNILMLLHPIEAIKTWQIGR